MNELNRDQQISLLRLARNSIAEDLDLRKDNEEAEFKDDIFREIKATAPIPDENSELEPATGNVSKNVR